MKEVNITLTADELLGRTSDVLIYSHDTIASVKALFGEGRIYGKALLHQESLVADVEAAIEEPLTNDELIEWLGYLGSNTENIVRKANDLRAELMRRRDVIRLAVRARQEVEAVREASSEKVSS